jgi:hypothetical protein
MGRLNLKEAERKAYRSTFQDGLWDILLGLAFLNFPILALVSRAMSETVSMIGDLMAWLIVVVVFQLAKRYITVPRMGLVKFGPARKRKLLKMHWILTGSFVLGLLVFLLFVGTDGDISGLLILGVFTANILIVLGLMAYLLDYERLYLYAVLFSVSLPLGEVLYSYAGLADPTYVFLVTGGGAVLIGLWLLRRFLRDYPLPPADASGELINGEV